MYSSLDHSLPKYIVTPGAVFAGQAYGDPSSGKWLEHAIPLNGVLIAAVPETRALAEHILPEIIEAIKAEGGIKKLDTVSGRSKLRQSVKVFLLNIYTAYLMGLPISYSRSTNSYVKHSAYARRFFKYDRVVAITKALASTGYVEQKEGFYDPEKKLGRQTRLWASKRLVELFQKMLLSQFKIAEPAERELLIELRDEGKNSIKYRPTKRCLQMKKNLLSYNEFIDKSTVEVKLDDESLVSLEDLYRYVLLATLHGDIEIVNLRVETDRVTYIKSTHQTIEQRSLYHNTSPSMTNKISCIDSVISELQTKKRYNFEPVEIASTATPTRQDQGICLATLSLIIKKHFFYHRLSRHKEKVSGKDLTKQRNLAKHPLSHFGIQSLELVIKKKRLYRVFSKKKFTLGGRFYGACHEMMPKSFRQQSIINGQPSVELDYSAHHLRMSYHLKGIDYQADPYLKLTTDKEERKIFKTLCLIAINAEDENKAIRGFRKKALKEGFEISLVDQNVRSLLDRVKKAHTPIADYIHSKKGLKLQYIDSQISEAILMRMTKQEIPCLPVHDSYVVPCQYGELLREVMREEYEKIMGFEPVIEKAKRDS